MTDKQIIINGFNLEYIKELLYNGQRSAISTNIFEAIIEELERKEQELQAQRNFTTQEQRKIYCVAYDKTCETGNECKQKKCVFKDRLKYKQALDEIEARIQLENADDCLLDVMEIIESVKEKI